LSFSFGRDLERNIPYSDLFLTFNISSNINKKALIPIKELSMKGNGKGVSSEFIPEKLCIVKV
jgi:hypothetical protein